MADEIMPNSIGLGNYPKRLADMNDGTWAEKVLATLALGGSQVSQANPLPVTIASGLTPLADQSVVDGAGTYWLVRDNGSTLTYINWSTGASGTPVGQVAPAGKLTGEQVLSTQYNAVAAGSGYAVGDVLTHFVILNIATSPASVIASNWLNLTQGSVLSASPPPAALNELTASMAVTSMPPLAAGSNAIGSVTVSNFPTMQTVAGTVTANAGTGTFAVSTASLPLPAGAATDASLTNGNQKTQVTVLPALPSGANLIGAVNLNIGGTSVSASNAVPVYDAYQAPVATTWTTATAVNTAATFTTNGYDTVIVTLGTNAAFAGGVLIFEVFDGVSWMPVKAASIINYTTTSATITPAANTTLGYQVPVAGFPQFRVRLSSVLTAGTLTVTGIISSAPDTSVVTVGMDPGQPLPAGTNTLGGVNVDTVVDATTQSASASAAGVILTQSAVGFNGGSFRLTGTFSATVLLEGSNDGGTTWDTLYFTQESPTATAVNSTTAAGLFKFGCLMAQVRLRVSAYTSGTVTGVIAMKRGAAPVVQSLGAGTALLGSTSLGASATIGTGATPARVATGASGVIKASAGKLFGSASIVNVQAAARYLQIYNKATAGVPGTDTPLMTIALAASAMQPPVLFSDIGLTFGTGISWAVTTDFAGATAGASGDVMFTLNYI